MQRYEALILTVPEITKDELKQMETQLDQLVADSKGSIISFEKWGKYKLSYSVRGNEYGVYCLFRFEAPANVVNEIRDFFAVKFHEIVMRSIITRLKGGSLTYQRPRSLEEASTSSRDMDGFLREHQMGGMLSAAEERGGREFASRMAQSEDEITDDEE